MTQDASRATYIVIMGAAVARDGGPSGAMRRRVRGAVRAAQPLGGKIAYLPTGGVGRHGPAEAEIMRGLLLESGVAPDCILLENRALDTLSSVENCRALLAGIEPRPKVLVVSDRYHMPRCVLLFRMYGVAARGLRIESGQADDGWPRWLYHHARECAALPWDAPLVLFNKLRCKLGSCAKA